MELPTANASWLSTTHAYTTNAHNSLSLVDTAGSSAAELEGALPQLASLATLRVMPRDHGLGTLLGRVAHLKLKQLKIRCVTAATGI